MICFTIPGEPVAKGRPKATAQNGHARMYTPAKTVAYESKVAIFASQAMAGRSPLDGAVSLQIHAYFAIPASWSKKRLQAHLVVPEWVVKRPDGDNVLKALADGMNGIVFKDDCQIAVGAVTKQYADVPRVEVMVTELL